MHQALSRDLYMHFPPHRITPGGNYVYPHFTGEGTEMWSFVHVTQPGSGGAGIQIEGG